MSIKGHRSQYRSPRSCLPVPDLNSPNLSFFLSWVTKTQLNHWTKRVTVVSIQLITQDPRNCDWPLPTWFMADPQWVKTVHNVCGLACILRPLTRPNNQVSLTTKEHSAQRIVLPHDQTLGEGHDQFLGECFNFFGLAATASRHAQFFFRVFLFSILFSFSFFTFFLFLLDLRPPQFAQDTIYDGSDGSLGSVARRQIVYLRRP